MKPKEFKKLYKKYSKLKEVTDKDEWNRYIRAIHKPKNDKIYLKKEIKRTGYKHRHCCLQMTYHLATASLIEDKNDADIIMKYSKRINYYGIPIHEGGSSSIQIKYCPCCGKKL